MSTAKTSGAFGQSAAASAAAGTPTLGGVEDEKQAESSEAEALREVAAEIAALRNALKKPTSLLGASSPDNIRELLTGESAAEARERGRVKREQDQARLYKMVVIFAALSAFAAVAGVVVALINS
jgi:hypothetical protein